MASDLNAIPLLPLEMIVGCVVVLLGLLVLRVRRVDSDDPYTAPVHLTIDELERLIFGMAGRVYARGDVIDALLLDKLLKATRRLEQGQRDELERRGQFQTP